MTAISQTAVFAERSNVRFWRAPAAVISTFVFPSMLLLMNLAVFNEVVGSSTGESYIDRIGALTVLSTASYGAAVTAAGFYRDVNSGFLTRVRSMPIPISAMLGGRLVGDMVRGLSVAVFTVLLAMIFGFRFSEGIPAAFAFFGVVMMFSIALSLFAMFMALRATGEEALQSALSAMITLLFILSSGFFPLEAFPSWVQPFVRINPLSLGTETLMGLSSGGPILTPFLKTLAWVVGIVVVCGVSAHRRFTALLRG